MATNPFDQFDAVDAGPAGKPASAKSANPFDQFGTFEEPPAPVVENKPSLLDHLKKGASWIGQGASEEYSKFATNVNLAASTPAVALDKLVQTFGSDPNYTGMEDKMFQTFVDPAVQTSQNNAISPTATPAEKLLHGIGATATMIGEVVATGGEAAPEIAAQETAGQALTKQLAHSTRAMQAPAISSAVDTGRRVLDETGDKETAIKAAQAAYLQNVVAGAVPLAKQGNLATRLSSGAASGVATSEASRAINNVVSPDQQQPFSLEDAAVSGVQGAMMGGVMGPRGEPASAGKVAPISPIDAIEAAQDQARTQSAAQGGDILDQELAAGKTRIEHQAVHDEAYVDQLHQNAAEDQLMQQQEQLRGMLDEDAAKQASISPEVAFAKREAEQTQTADAQREADYPKAQFEAEMQKGETAQFEQPADEPLATLGDFMPKNLAERRAAEDRQTGSANEAKVVEETANVPEEQPATAQERPTFTESEQPEKVNMLQNPVTSEEVTREMQRKAIDEAAHEAATSPKNDLPEPTEAQIDAGNYKKGHIDIHGLDVTIENPKGSTRSGTTPEGREWSTEMKDHYGYIRGTEGADGQHVDTFVGDHPDSDKVYVVDQLNQRTGGFDEHKALMGYRNQLDAVRAYKRNFEKGWKVGPVKEMSVPEFKEWAKNGDTTRALQPDKISEAVPATEEQVQQAAGMNAKRGEQTVRYALADRNIGSVGRTSRVSEFADQAPEKGLGIVKTGDSEWTIFNDRKPLQSYANPLRAHSDMRDLKVESGLQKPALDKESSEFLNSYLNEPKGLSKEEAEAAVHSVFKNAKDFNIHVHKDYASMPEGEAKKRLRENQTSAKNLGDDITKRVKGVYDSEADEVHIFADRHPNAESVMKTVVHETIAHKGLKALLKDRMADTMQEIHDNANFRERKGIEKTAERYSLDLSKPADQRLAAEEHIAKLSESGIDSPMIHRAIAAVRAALRRMGLVKGWSNEDIKALLRDSRRNLDEKARAADMADKRIRYNLGETDPIVNEQPRNPLSQLAKFGATMESQAKYSPDLLHRVRDSLANFGESKGRSAVQAFLATIPRDKLPDFVGKDGKESLVPSAQHYVDTARKMDNRRNKLFVQDEKVARKWSKLQKKSPLDAGSMSSLMHAATLAGVDPSKEFEYSHPGIPQTREMRELDAQRRIQHTVLRKYWAALPPEAKSLYKEVQQAYQEKRAQVEKALEDRINGTDATPDAKKSLLDTLRQQFESNRIAGPYFPLSRFGEYWGAAKNKAGEVMAASRFETPQEQRAWREEFKKAGYDTDGGRNMDQHGTAKAINPEFVAKVMDFPGMTKDLADSIWQKYMESLPEMSMRKSFMHRKGRLGFSGDALRAFGTNMFHSSHQLARLEHMHKLEGHLQQMEKQVRKLESADHPEARWARPLMSEMQLRHEWAMNPKSSPLASALTSLGFAYHLIASPAAGFVNLTQTPMVAGPVLAGEFGAARTIRELGKAAIEVAGAKFRPGELGDRLVSDERRAMAEAQDAGIFGRTQAHMLAGATNEEGFNLTNKRTQAMEVASFFFHKAEEFNRKSTFLAAFRLAKKQGLDYDAAFDKADKLTMDSHFDVSNANRARVLQSNTAKVIGLFKSYALNMTYRVARDFRESIRDGAFGKTGDPEARAAAQKRFAGMMGTVGLMAGTSGVPLSWAIHAAVNAVFSDDNNDFDSEDAFRAHLTEALGSKAATAIVRGPFEAATGLSMSDRVGLNNLWIQSPPENAEGEDLNRFYLEQAAGPALSPFLSVAPAAKLVGQGYYERAVEKLMPKAGADVIKAMRYYREGATDMRGNVIMPKDEFSAKQLFFQGVGFVPEELATINAQNRAIKGAEQKLLKRKTLLMDKYFLAARVSDADGVQEAIRDIAAFDKANPSIAIGVKNIVASAKARARFNAEAVEGSTVTPQLAYLHQRYKFTPKKEETANDGTR